MGQSARATGQRSTAIGNFSRARGSDSTALGGSSQAFSTDSTALGQYTHAQGRGGGAYDTAVDSGARTASDDTLAQGLGRLVLCAHEPEGAGSYSGRAGFVF